MLSSPDAMDDFPDGVTFVLMPLAEAALAPCDPREEALVSARAVEKRHRELRAGRHAAHLALARAGCVDHAAPILRGPRNEPLWPAGWVGAITHADTWVGAAVAPRARAAGIGVDVESLSRTVGSDITHLVCLPDEVPWVAGHPDRLRTLFSAKETVFKALFPIGGVFLDFKDARLRWQGGAPEVAGTFEAELLVDASPAHPAGYRFPIRARRLGEGHVLTSAVLDP